MAKVGHRKEKISKLETANAKILLKMNFSAVARPSKKGPVLVTNPSSSIRPKNKAISVPHSTNRLSESSARSLPYLLAAKTRCGIPKGSCPYPPKQINARDICQSCSIFPSDEIVHRLRGFLRCRSSTIKVIFCEGGIRLRQTPYMKYTGNVLVVCV